MSRKANPPSIIATATLITIGAVTLGLLATGAALPEAQAKPKKKKAKGKGTTLPPPPEPAEDEPEPEPPPAQDPEPDAPLVVNNGIKVNGNCTKALVFDRDQLDTLIAQELPFFLEYAEGRFDMDSIIGFRQFLSTFTYWGLLAHDPDTNTCPGFASPFGHEDELSKFELALFTIMGIRAATIMFDAELITPQVYSDYIQAINANLAKKNINNSYLVQAGLG